MVFAAADSYFDGRRNVQEVRTEVVDSVSFFLGFVALDHYWVIFVLASPGARPDRVVDTDTHDANCWGVGKRTAMLAYGISDQAAWPCRCLCGGIVSSGGRMMFVNLSEGNVVSCGKEERNLLMDLNGLGADFKRRV